MRLTRHFAFTALWLAALAALPLWRLWSVSAEYGHAPTQHLAVALTVGGAFLLAMLVYCIHALLARPLGLLADALAAPPEQSVQLSRPVLEDLAAVVHALPLLRRANAGAGASGEALLATHSQLEARMAELAVRTRHLQLLADAIPMGLELRSADGQVVLSNELWNQRSGDARSNSIPVFDAQGNPAGELHTDMGLGANAFIDTEFSAP